MIIRSHIIVHESDTEDGPTNSWDAIRRYHMTPPDKGGPKDGPYRDIAYHYGLERLGDVLILLPGRPWHIDGAHCQTRNATSLGYCVVGKFDFTPPSPEIVKAVIDSLAWLCLVWQIPPFNILGHREGDPNTTKTCPGRMWDLGALRSSVRDRLRVSSPPGQRVILSGLVMP